MPPTRHLPPLPHRRPLKHPLLPSLESGKISQLHPRPPAESHPAPVRDVGDRAFVADQVGGGGSCEVRVQDAVEAAHFVLVALLGVGNGFGGVAREVVCLALRGA